MRDRWGVRGGNGAVSPTTQMAEGCEHLCHHSHVVTPG